MYSPSSFSPCYVLHIYLIHYLISLHANNAKLDQMKDTTSTSSNNMVIKKSIILKCLCFLNEYITNIPLHDMHSSISSITREYINYKEFQSVLIEVFEYNNDLLQDFQIKLQHKLDNLNQFYDFISDLNHLFTEDISIYNINKLTCPIRITRTSLYGIFIRVFLVQWNMFSFEATCQIYDSLINFLQFPNRNQNLHDEVKSMDNFQVFIGRHDKLQNVIPHASLPSKSQLVFEIQKAFASNDIYAAEQLLHEFFDSNDLPILNVLSMSPVGTSIDNILPSQQNISTAFLSLQSIISSSNSTVHFEDKGKHQLALLSLSILYLLELHHQSNGLGCKDSRDSLYTLAMNTLDEALKIAHSRGDNLTVAKTLLMLYHFHSINKENNHSNHEELLVRCIDKAAHLHDKQLVAQASLMLAQHRAQHALSPTQVIRQNDILSNSRYTSPLDEHLDNYEVNTNSRIPYFHNFISSTSVVWWNISSALIGDLKQCHLLSKCLIVEQVEEAISLQQQGKSSSYNLKSLQLVETIHSYDEYLEYVLPAFYISKLLWERFGQYDMILLQSRIIVSYHFDACPNRDKVNILCTMARVMMEDMNQQLLKQDNYHELVESDVMAITSRTYTLASKIVTRAQQLFPVSLPVVFPLSIQFTMNYIDAMNAFYSKEYDKAMIYIDYCLTLSSSHTPNYDLEYHENEHDDDVYTWSWSWLHAKCHVLKARILECQGELETYCKALHQIERVCSKSIETLEFQYIAMILRANYYIKYNIPMNYISPALYMEALKASKMYQFPTISTYAKKNLIIDAMGSMERSYNV